MEKHSAHSKYNMMRTLLKKKVFILEREGKTDRKERKTETEITETETGKVIIEMLTVVDLYVIGLWMVLFCLQRFFYIPTFLQ